MLLSKLSTQQPERPLQADKMHHAQLLLTRIEDKIHVAQYLQPKSIPFPVSKDAGELP